MPPDPPSALLDRVRKLLAKAEAEGVTPPEAEALTAKAAELMARYGIDRARLAAADPATDKPGARIVDIANPWADVRAHLLGGLAQAMRCQCVMLHTDKPGARIHVFGYQSDLQRSGILYTSLLLQMDRALDHAAVPAGVRSVRAWRRSYLLGFCTAVIARVKTAEGRSAATPAPKGEPSTELMLSGRSAWILRLRDAAYADTPLRKTRVTYSGRGYGSGYAEGQRADVGHARLRSTRTLPG